MPVDLNHHALFAMQCNMLLPTFRLRLLNQRALADLPERQVPERQMLLWANRRSRMIKLSKAAMKLAVAEGHQSTGPVQR